MDFFTTIQPIQLLVGNLITEAVTLSDLQSSLTKATREVQKLFPKVFLERLLNPPSGTPLTEDETEILASIREAIANMAVLRYIPMVTGKITGSGFQQYETDKFKALFKYQKNDIEEELTKSGYEALELALFLYVTLVPDQTQLEEYKKATARLLNFTQEADIFQLDYLTLKGLLPYVELIEIEVVKPLLTAALYTDLKTNQYNDQLHPTKKELLQYVRQGLTQYIITLALQLNAVKIQGNTVTLRQWKDDDASQERTIPRMDLIEMVKRTRDDYAHRFFQYVKLYLKENATTLGYVEPETEQAVSTTFITQKGIKTL